MAINRPPPRILADDTKSIFHETHANLLQLVDRILEADDAGAAAPLIEEIRAVLPGHFTREESRDGLFDWIAALAPRLGPELDALQNDHTNLLRRLYQLESAPEADFVADAHALATALRAHEAQERKVLTRAVHDS